MDAYLRFLQGRSVNEESGCWEWQRAKNPAGYGMFWHDGKMTLAHRFSYESETGRPLRGLCALHRCDNPSCVNPNHLFAGTRADNRRDAMQKGRPLPAPRGERSPKTHLTEQDVQTIRSLRSQGFGYRFLGRKFAVTHGAIRNICLGKTWKHLAKN